MEKIKGIIRQEVLDCGSKSEGVHTFLEIPDSDITYKLYRQNVYSVNDNYFDQFKDKIVLIVGEVEHQEWINVEQINIINIEDK